MSPHARPLQRLLGTPTAWLLGMGVAIGSGIFRTPGEVAAALPSAAWILLAWVIAGLIVLAQGLVSAELATRFPRAGGEYVFLREAYGEFAAFFFGWAYSIFIIGVGSAVIALALGDFAAELVGVAPGEPDGAAGGPHARFVPEVRAANVFAAAAVLAVALVNALGLRAGAGLQNTLTVLKIGALLAIVVAGLGWGAERADWGLAIPPAAAGAGVAADGSTAWLGLASALLAAVLPALWSYEGTTDPVKMAEEIKDVRRALPRAVIGATLSLVALYGLVNVALLRVIPVEQLAGATSAPGEAFARLLGERGRRAMLVIGILVCLGSLSSTMLATVRVTFALARDGLAPRVLGRMSARQAPVGALLGVAGLAMVVTLFRDFERALGIYFFAAAILFGLSYGALLIFRARERRFPEHAFRCPGGPVIAALLIVTQLAIAAHIAAGNWRDAAGTAVLLGVLVGVYGVMRRGRRRQLTKTNDE